MVFISLGPRALDTRFSNRKSFFRRTPSQETCINPSRTFDHCPRNDRHSHDPCIREHIRISIIFLGNRQDPIDIRYHTVQLEPYRYILLACTAREALDIAEI
jgi:hypothetical protein